MPRPRRPRRCPVSRLLPRVRRASLLAVAPATACTTPVADRGAATDAAAAVAVAVAPAAPSRPAPDVRGSDSDRLVAVIVPRREVAVASRRGGALISVE